MINQQNVSEEEITTAQPATYTSFPQWHERTIAEIYENTSVKVIEEIADASKTIQFIGEADSYKQHLEEPRAHNDGRTGSNVKEKESRFITQPHIQRGKNRY